VRPQSPAPTARNTDEMVIPGRVGVVVASRVLTTGAFTTVGLPRCVHPACSPGLPTGCAGPVVDPGIDTRSVHGRNSFRLPTLRAPGDNHTASGWYRTAGRLPIDKDRFRHNASTVGFQRRHLLVRPAEAGRANEESGSVTISRAMAHDRAREDGALHRCRWFMTASQSSGENEADREDFVTRDSSTRRWAAFARIAAS